MLTTNSDGQWEIKTSIGICSGCYDIRAELKEHPWSVRCSMLVQTCVFCYPISRDPVTVLLGFGEAEPLIWARIRCVTFLRWN